MAKFKREYQADVVVVGSGAAALSAAITATSQGAEVIMVEKAGMVGGTTLRSGGGFWTPNNRFMRKSGLKDKKQDATRYMARYSFPQLYNPADKRLGLPENEYNLISTYYDNASKAVEHLEGVGALKSIQEINWTGKPQVDYAEMLPENGGVRGRVLYSMGADGKLAYGGELVRQLKTWLDGKGIKIILNHRVSRIMRNAQGRVTGVLAEHEGGTSTFHAKKAVIFGTGGFTHNPELMLRFQRGPHFGGCASPGSTGDFVYMAGAIGAQFGNMASAFHAEIVLEQALADPNGVHNVFYVMGDSVLEVDRCGLRFGDEKRNYNDRGMTHFVWDPLRAEWRNMLIFMIYDQRTAIMWQGFPPMPVQGVPAPPVISGKTLDELAAGIDARLKSLAPHTGGFALDEGLCRQP